MVVTSSLRSEGDGIIGKFPILRLVLDRAAPLGLSIRNELADLMFPEVVARRDRGPEISHLVFS